MRIAIYVVSFLVLAYPAYSGELKFRPATEAEILRHLPGSSEMKKAEDGFGYKRGNPNGYKISHGKICVIAPQKSVDCVSVRTNGSVFRMIDTNGNRENF